MVARLLRILIVVFVVTVLSGSVQLVNLEYPWEQAAVDVVKVKSLTRHCFVCLLRPASEITPAPPTR